MKIYEQPGIIVKEFFEQDVLTASNGLENFDDVGVWGGWFDTNWGGGE